MTWLPPNTPDPEQPERVPRPAPQWVPRQPLASPRDARKRRGGFALALGIVSLILGIVGWLTASGHNPNDLGDTLTNWTFRPEAYAVVIAVCIALVVVGLIAVVVGVVRLSR